MRQFVPTMVPKSAPPHTCATRRAHRSPHSFFIMSSTFLARSAGPSWPSPLAANLATYISANCFRVKAQPCKPDPKPTVPRTGSIWRSKYGSCSDWRPPSKIPSEIPGQQGPQTLRFFNRHQVKVKKFQSSCSGHPKLSTPSSSW